MNKQNILIAVAWPYVNGNPHIGHLAGYLLPADITARFHRLLGDNVLMVSGSDCHGTPITVEADKRGVTPKEIADEYHEKDVDLFLNVLKLTYDLYTRTDTPHHAKVTQDIFLKLLEKGYVSINTSEQYYSETEKRFLPDRYVVGTCPHCSFNDARSDQCDNCGKLLDQGELINPKSKLSDSIVTLKETEHYFVDWGKLQPQIESYVNRVSGDWKEWVREETKGWLAEGLKPRPVTRDIDWGVEIPVDRISKDMQIENAEHKRFYVWFDAVIGYLSASILWSEENKKDWQEFWYDEVAAKEGSSIKHFYFMGKDNLAFHTMLWPGKLIVYDEKLHLPDVASINMFLNLDGQQFSKSRGVVIDSREIVEKYGNDMVRFYLTYIMPEQRDTSFTWEDFQLRINNILIGNFGNFIHRVLSIGNESNLEEIANEPLAEETRSEILDAMSGANDALQKCEFKRYLDTVLALSAYGNRQFDYLKMWQLKKADPAAFMAGLKQFYTLILALAYLTQPLLFESSDKIFAYFNLTIPSSWPKLDEFAKTLENNLSVATINSKPQPLFTRVEI